MEELLCTENARVASIDLAAGECSPWHYHSDLIENIFCLIGPIIVEREPATGPLALQPGERYRLEPRHRHRLTNPADTPARY